MQISKRFPSWLVVILAAIVTIGVTSVVAATRACAAEGMSYGVGLYSSYVLGVGNRVDNAPVLQGWARHTTSGGVYVEGWGSLSLKRPGGFSRPGADEEHRFGNEVDLTLGLDQKLGERWSLNANIAHFDIVNPRLVDFSGDLVAVAATLRYHATPQTSVYLNVEDYEGYGENRFHGGQRLSLALASSLGPVSYDLTLRRNNHVGGPISGELLKLSLSSTDPLFKIGRAGFRPEVIIYAPIGRYADTHRTYVVGGIAGNW